MRPAANHPDVLRQSVVAGIPIRMEPARKALEECFGILRLPVLLVLIQNYGMLGVSASPVQPHIALAPGCLPFQLQHLQGCFIRMENLALKQLPVQVVIDGPQPVLRHPQHPVAHRLPGEHHPSTIPFLFLPVQRSVHHKLLHHDMGHSLRGGIAARNQGRLFGGFQDRCFRPCLLAVLAGVCKINIFPDLHLGRDHYQSTAHLGPNLCHERTAFRTVTFRLRDAVLHHLNRDVLRQNLLHTGGSLLPGMSGNPGFPRGSPPGRQPCFRLIKHETQLANQLLLRLLGGCPIDLLFGKTHLFHQPVQLLVQFVSFRL